MRHVVYCDFTKRLLNAVLTNVAYDTANATLPSSPYVAGLAQTQETLRNDCEGHNAVTQEDSYSTIGRSKPSLKLAR
jgi:hypothetical protein